MIERIKAVWNLWYVQLPLATLFFGGLIAITIWGQRKEWAELERLQEVEKQCNIDTLPSMNEKPL